ncbi:MAG: methenyltetrahydromethanopterin cyclohydrolase, partial [Planctomycetota bacterium]
MVQSLNQRALHLVKASESEFERLGINSFEVEGGGRVIDCGVKALGGPAAGMFAARLTMADLGSPRLETDELKCAAEVGAADLLQVRVETESPLLACMASQYAGWRVSVGDFSGMGSGPVRLALGREELFTELDLGKETTDCAVGFLETSSIPGPEVFEWISNELGLDKTNIVLAVARTGSPSGTIQVVSRSVET